MTTLPNIFKISQRLKPGVGRVLISEPLMNEGIFGRSVVLLVENNADGTIGYILNKHSGFTIQQLLPLFKGFTSSVFIGGPVATNSVHFIYKAKENLLNSKKIGENLYWGGNINELHKMMVSNMIDPNDVRFFVGYSGWAKNQLNEELLKGFWIVNYFSKEVYFEDNAISVLWKRNVVLLEKKFHFWLNIPVNPSLN